MQYRWDNGGREAQAAVDRNDRIGLALLTLAAAPLMPITASGGGTLGSISAGIGALGELNVVVDGVYAAAGNNGFLLDDAMDVRGAYTVFSVITGLTSLGTGLASGLRRGTTLAAESEAAAGLRAVHKNSLDYVGDTHVYVIRNPDGTLYKVGESAQGVRVTDGASIRAEMQARALRKETGDFYTTEIRQNFGGKADARAYETRFIQTYERLYGQRPPGNPLDR